jgi:hypothetical protein
MEKATPLAYDHPVNNYFFRFKALILLLFLDPA